MRTINLNQVCEAVLHKERLDPTFYHRDKSTIFNKSGWYRVTPRHNVYMGSIPETHHIVDGKVYQKSCVVLKMSNGTNYVKRFEKEDNAIKFFGSIQNKIDNGFSE